MGENNVENLEILKECVEQSVGRRMATPKDFDYLVARIYSLTNTHISATTMKRLWGYQRDAQQFTPRVATLDLLARVAGYVDYGTLLHAKDTDACNSDFINKKRIATTSLMVEDRLRLMWKPNRCVTIKYLGHSMFRVEESENSKLSVGDTFLCEHLISGEALYLYSLIHENGLPTDYVCGKLAGGITFDKL